jgi:hypothetical protein
MDLSTREADAAFADLICADPQWLDAEFDALVSASFSEPPPPPPAPPRVPPRRGTPRPPSRRQAPGPATAKAAPATASEYGRQRSPPAHFPVQRLGRGPRP